MPIAANVCFASNVGITYPDLVNLYGCTIGEGTRIGPFVEIQKNSSIGTRCKVGSHTFICEGVTVEDEVFLGHHVCFINDRHPRPPGPRGNCKPTPTGKSFPRASLAEPRSGSAP